MRLPSPRGPLSTELCRVLGGTPGEVPALVELARGAAAVTADPLADEDLQLSLHVLYELHYQGFAGVDPEWEWAPGLLAARAHLEGALERGLIAAVAPPEAPAPTAEAVAGWLRRFTADDDGPSLSLFLARSATAEQFQEFLVHRSVYELKEADPHTWAIPRLSGRAKAALVEVQADEYGGGRPERMHATLYARSLRAVGLCDLPGEYVDDVPAVTLATVTAMSFFGLHRRLRGAVAGHLAAFELTSTEPNRRYGSGLRRLGCPPDATIFFDEHVEADAVHEQLAAHDLAGALVEDAPELLPDVLFGAAAAMELERRFAAHVLGAWAAGRSSLRSSSAAAPGPAALLAARG